MEGGPECKWGRLGEHQSCMNLVRARPAAAEGQRVGRNESRGGWQSTQHAHTASTTKPPGVPGHPSGLRLAPRYAVGQGPSILLTSTAPRHAWQHAHTASTTAPPGVPKAA